MAYENLVPLDVSYDNKAYGNKIDPYEWNENFKQIEVNVNQNLSELQLILTNHLEQLNNRYTVETTDTKINEETKDLIQNFDVNLTTGVITVTKKDGTIETYDTALEKIPATFSFVEKEGSYFLKIENQDGTISQVNVTSLMNLYSFLNSDEISFTVSGEGTEKTVSANLRDNSVTLKKLSTEVVSRFEKIREQAESSIAVTQKNVEDAQTIADEMQELLNETENFSIVAQSYSEGGTGVREGEDTDNAKYYAEQAKREADRATEIVGADYVTEKEFLEYKTEILNAASEDATSKVNDLKQETSEVLNNLEIELLDEIDVAKQNAITEITNQKGTANGFASLNETGKVSIEQLPEFQTDSVFDYAKESGYEGTEEEFKEDLINIGNSSIKFNTVETTLLAANWTGENAPYTYELNVQDITSDTIQDFLPPLVPDPDNYETTKEYTVAYEQWEVYVDALQAADMYDGGQTSGVATIVAKGEKPTIDLPVRVIVTESAESGSDSSGENTETNTSSLPVGSIIMWSGAEDTIPECWALCNGENGTPDLRGRFIIGAGTGEDETATYYGVGDTGGEATHVLTASEMPVHKHSASTASAGAHTHTWAMANTYKSGSSNPGIELTEGRPYARGNLDGTVAKSNTGSSGAHTHTMTVGNTGGGGAHENRPPYYALCFIMYLGVI